jgi:hypothetical protein
MTAFRTLSTLAAALLPSLALAAPVIVTNGDFSAAGSAPVGWTVAPGSEIGVASGFDYQPCCGTSGTATELGNRFVAFGAGNVANTSTLLQAVGTHAGRYMLSFDAGALGGGQQTLTANVYDASNNIIATFSKAYTANNALGSTFSSETLSFKANGASKIAFSVDGVTNGVDGVLDNVMISGVPEASTWSMMIIGMGGIAAVTRRRRARGTAHA